MNWSNTEINHVKPLCMFDMSINHEIKEAFNWKNTQPLLEEIHQKKGNKYNFLNDHL